ncbi:MAG TPA: (Fe-S)-binding protein, partial [Gammaproteobacteria bacterium]
LAGCRVSVPLAQTCCGQPAYSQGAQDEARALARQVIETCAGFDHVVLPSGSCAAMIRCHYPELFADDPLWQQRARTLAGRTHELTSFLTDVMQFTDIKSVKPVRAAYHDSCSGYRELGVQGQPRRLLEQVDGVELLPLAEPEACCGFGGTFCVKYPEIAERMAAAKAAAVTASGAELLLGGDLGCLLNLAGTLRRQRQPVAVRHVAEVLAGMLDAPAIGED